MASQPCDGCGERVTIAGGIANIWTMESDTTGGIDLELADDSEFFLCFACIESLPDDHDVTEADVRELQARHE